MRIYVGLVVVSLLALGGLGCNQQPVSAAPEGAPPGIEIPVGPIPGPGREAMKLPTNPYYGDQVALAEGRRLFLWYNCYGCHGGHGGGGMGPSLRDPRWRYGDSDAHIFASIAEGRADGMPAWGSKIPSDQIWKLVAYIKSMRTPEEPDPPILPPPVPPTPHVNK
ncbi:MAG TPA: c-type cytochrome [Terriglobales bacterium]|nr:c-type cytochrome [Terriglobales bacterium]